MLSHVTKANIDAGGDKPSLARVELSAAVDRINDLVDITNGLDGVYASSYPSLALADADAYAAGKALIISTQWDTVPAAINSAVRMAPGGKLNNSGSVTFAADFVCGPWQCFIGSGTVAFTFNSTVMPEWWNKDIGKAVTSLPATGGRVILQNDIYTSPFNSNANKLTKSNIAFIGARMPAYNSLNTALENGTIIRDTFWVYANYISIQDLGIDVGSANFATARDGFLIAADISHPTATTPWKGFRAENIRVLCRNATDANHAFLCEYVQNAFVKNIHTKFNTHGIVFKAIYSTATGLYATDHSSEGVIIKSDSYANSGLSEFTNIVINNSTAGSGNGLQIYGATAPLTHVNISGVVVNNAVTGVLIQGGASSVVEDVHITGVNVTNSTQKGIDIEAYSQYVTISKAASNSNTQAACYIAPNANYITIANYQARNNSWYGIDNRGNGTRLSKCIVRNGGSASAYLTQPTWIDDCYFPVDSGQGGISMGGGKIIGDVSVAVTAPTFTNSWVNYGGAGNPAACWWVDNGRVRLSGLVKSGTVGLSMFTLPSGYRPAYTYRQAVTCFNGTTAIHGQIAIGTDGTVTLEYGANNYVSLSGVEFSLAFD